MAVDPNDPYWTQALNDPTVTAAKGAGRKYLSNLITNYGDPSALSAEERARFGVTDADLSGAAANPYSVQAGLAKLLSGDQYTLQNTANSRGALFSGAHQAGQLGEVEAGKQRNYSAQQALAAAIASGADNPLDATISGAYGRISTNAALAPLPAPALPDASAVPAAPAAPAPAAAPVNGLGAPWVDPGARESLTQPPPNPTLKALSAAQLAAQAKRGFTGHA